MAQSDLPDVGGKPRERSDTQSAGLLGAAAPAAAVVDGLKTRFAAERERWILWSPVCLGAGIGIYFVQKQEPGLLQAGLVAGLPLLLFFLLLRRHRQSPGDRAETGPLILVCAAGLMLAGLGFAAAKLRTEWVRAPVLVRDAGPGRIVGNVLYAEAEAGGGWRVVLHPTDIEGVSAGRLPVKVRLVSRQAGPEPVPGNRVETFGVLRPPPSPATPWSYDFARQAWFDRLGGVGYTLKAFSLRPATEQSRDFGTRLRATLARLRLDITRRVLKVLPGPSGRIAAALMTGQRRSIPEDTLDDLRKSGLAHLLAISGLHMALVGGLLFLATRQLLALVPAVALRYPIKKWAAIVGLAGSLAYLAISGASPATQRAFVMSTLVFVAILCDRTAISLRNLALAGFALLLFRPESLMNISFQMSFAALVGLVAFYEAVRGRAFDWDRPRRQSVVGRVMRWGLLYIAGLIATAAVAGASTGLFAAYHFNRIVVLGVAANLLAMPVVGLVIMPCLLGALLLMPFGLERAALLPMGGGIDWVLAVAHRVAHLPHSTLSVPHIPAATLVLLCFAGLWLCLWRGDWRYWGLALVPVALLYAQAAPRPFVMVNRDGRNLVVSTRSGEAAALFARRSRFEQEQWARFFGVSGLDANGLSQAAFRCDPIGCIGEGGRAPPRTIAYIEDARGFREDCTRADIVVTPLAMPRSVKRSCGTATVKIDFWTLRTGGSQALFETPRGLKVYSANDRRGRRPWTTPGH